MYIHIHIFCLNSAEISYLLGKGRGQYSERDYEFMDTWMVHDKLHIYIDVPHIYVG